MNVLSNQQKPASKPEDLAAAFKEDAEKNTPALSEIWQRAAMGGRPGLEDDGLKHWQVDDASLEIPFCELDCSAVVATSDTLIEYGYGLQAFLGAGETLGRRPNQGLVLDAGPAIMNYGRAIRMFGEPPEASAVATTDSTEDSLETSMANYPFNTNP